MLTTQSTHSSEPMYLIFRLIFKHFYCLSCLCFALLYCCVSFPFISFLINIFNRCVRYSNFFQRKNSVIPSLKYFANLVRDELKIKYAGTRFHKYASCPTEAAAILWMKTELGWTQCPHNRQIYPCRKNHRL